MAETKQTRERSTIRFPYLDLDDAVELAAKALENFGYECTLDQLVGALRQSISGAFRNKVASAATFGVLETVRGGVMVTDLGAAALDPQTSDLAKVDLFLSVPLYAKVV